MLSFFTLPAKASERSRIKTIQNVTVPIVAFTSSNGNKQKFKVYGTGFVFQWKRRIVTCASVIDSIPSKHFIPSPSFGILVSQSKDNGGSTKSHIFHSTTVTSVDRKNDIALLEVDSDLPLIPLKKIEKQLELASHVAIVGWHKKEMIQSYYSGYVTAILPAGKGRSSSYALLDFPVGVGVHGGPVFNPKTGALLGVARIQRRFLDRKLFPINGYESENMATAAVIPLESLLATLAKVD